MTKICLVRHGLTDYNAHRKLQGASDIPLNYEGEYQAQCAGEKLKDYHFDVIITSPLMRAYRTAEIINEYHGLEIETMDELKEQRSEEHTSELQSRGHLVCRLLLEKKKSVNRGLGSEYA